MLGSCFCTLEIQVLSVLGGWMVTRELEWNDHIITMEKKGEKWVTECRAALWWALHWVCFINQGWSCSANKEKQVGCRFASLSQYPLQSKCRRWKWTCSNTHWSSLREFGCKHHKHFTVLNIKKAVKISKRNEYRKTKNFSPSFLYASQGNRNHRSSVEKKRKKNHFFFPAGSFSSLFSHLRYNPPVKRIFWLSVLKEDPHLPIIQYWFKLLGFLSFWPPVFYDVFKTLWLLWTI